MLIRRQHAGAEAQHPRRDLEHVHDDIESALIGMRFEPGHLGGGSSELGGPSPLAQPERSAVRPQGKPDIVGKVRHHLRLPTQVPDGGARAPSCGGHGS